MTRKTEVSAGIIPFRVNDGQLEVLVLNARTGDWEFPKGGIEGNEELQQTALREAEEELDATDIRLIDGFRTEYSYSFYWDDQPVDKTVHLFLGEVFDESVSLSKEHSEKKWLSPEEALNQVSHSGMETALDQALDHLQTKGYYPSGEVETLPA